jgi:hypothetical protein
VVLNRLASFQATGVSERWREREFPNDVISDQPLPFAGIKKRFDVALQKIGGDSHARSPLCWLSLRSHICLTLSNCEGPSKGPQGQKRPAETVANAIRVAKILTGEIEEEPRQPKADAAEISN